MWNQILIWLKIFNRDEWRLHDDDDDGDQKERASKQVQFVFSMPKVSSICERIQQSGPYCVNVYFTIVIRLLLLVRMLDASGIYAHKHRSVNNIRNCVCVCAFVASLLFPLLQTLFACIIKSCNKIVVAVASIPFCSCCTVMARMYGDVFIFWFSHIQFSIFVYI